MYESQAGYPENPEKGRLHCPCVRPETLKNILCIQSQPFSVHVPYIKLLLLIIYYKQHFYIHVSQDILKGHVHDLGQCLFTKIILREILI